MFMYNYTCKNNPSPSYSGSGFIFGDSRYYHIILFPFSLDSYFYIRNNINNNWAKIS